MIKKLEKIWKYNTHLTEADDIELDRYLKSVEAFDRNMKVYRGYQKELEACTWDDLRDRDKIIAQMKQIQIMAVAFSREANTIAASLCLTSDTRPENLTADADADDFVE